MQGTSAVDTLFFANFAVVLRTIRLYVKAAVVLALSSVVAVCARPRRPFTAGKQRPMQKKYSIKSKIIIDYGIFN